MTKEEILDELAAKTDVIREFRGPTFEGLTGEVIAEVKTAR